MGDPSLSIEISGAHLLIKDVPDISLEMSAPSPIVLASSLRSLTLISSKMELDLTASIHPKLKFFSRKFSKRRCVLFYSLTLICSLPSSPINWDLVWYLFGSCQNTKKAVTPCPISRRDFISRCSVDTPYGGNVPTFPRGNVWDPYKWLGVSPYASEEEIWGSCNFLLQQFAGHERSEESIEAAFEKLLMTSFKQRKKTKIYLKSRLKKKVEESPPWIQNLLNFVEFPPMEIIFRRLFLFAFMGGWSIMNSAEGGPAFQLPP
ncbi:hypothetical protein LWI28_027930 [Acer negundo]|uniref:Uncharacterized protein n=1 Tax=Acer negundo TaxID=4023 RepID=A0AAD5JNG6_ACENE|nr:hypothetical protein LWI28_027930 [Acer negundo]